MMTGRTRPRWRPGPVRRAVVAAAIAAVLVVWLFLNLRGIYFRDALAYWRPDLDDLYGGRTVGVASTYLYSPAFAQLISPLGLLPWAAFAALWSALNLAALVWMAGPILAALLLLIPWSPVVDEVSTGNIHLLLGAAVVIGFRWPAAWAFPILTKATPGVGVLWFLGRRGWRDLAFAAGTAAGVALISFVLAPQAWFDWVDTLSRSSGVPVPVDIAVIPGPLWARTAVAAVVAVAGGIAGWRWLVPVAVTIALPVPWSSGLAVLVALIPLTWTAWPTWARRLARPFSQPDSPT